MSVRIKTQASIDWYGEEVLMKLQSVARDGIRAIAIETETQTKLNIQVPFEHADGSMRGQIDTGAMINSVRAEFAPISNAPPQTVAAVNVPVEYAAFQESEIRPFLWPAAQKVSEGADRSFMWVARKQGLSG